MGTQRPGLVQSVSSTNTASLIGNNRFYFRLVLCVNAVLLGKYLLIWIKDCMLPMMSSST